MTSPRLRRLSNLTQGAALVGIGIAAAGCTKNDPQQLPGTASPSATDTPAVTAPSATPSDSASPLPTHRFPIPNAMPPRRPLLGDAGAGGDSGG